MAQIQYTPYVNQNPISFNPINLEEFDIPIIKGRQKPKEEISLAPLPELKVVEPIVEETPVIVKGAISNPKKYNVGNMQDALDALANAGISFRVTSGIRPGAMTASGHRSNHADGNAVDIVIDNNDWEDAKKKIKASKELQALFNSKGWGILEETTPDVMRSTNATGAHWHIGPDKRAIENFKRIIAKYGTKLQSGNKIQYTPHINLEKPSTKLYETNIQFWSPQEQQPMVLIQEKPKEYQRKYNLVTEKPMIEEEPIITKMNPIAGVNMNNLEAINNKLKDAGFGKIQRAAILATVCQESKANPEAIGDNGKARGLFQWHGSRFNAGSDLNSQVQLIIDSLRDFKDVNGWLNNKKWSRKESFDKFNGDSLQDAITALTYSFIRPSNPEKRSNERFEIANEIYNQLI